MKIALEFNVQPVVVKREPGEEGESIGPTARMIADHIGAQLDAMAVAGVPTSGLTLRLPFDFYMAAARTCNASGASVLQLLAERLNIGIGMGPRDLESPSLPPRVERPASVEDARREAGESDLAWIPAPMQEIAEWHARRLAAEVDRIISETPPHHFAVIGDAALRLGGWFKPGPDVWEIRYLYRPASLIKTPTAGLPVALDVAPWTPIPWKVGPLNDGSSTWQQRQGADRGKEGTSA